MKRCCSCKIEKAWELFSKHSHTVDGRQASCKECQRKYRKENLEHSRKYQAKWRKENWVKAYASQKKYLNKNASVVNEKRRAYYQANAERIRARNKLWLAKNPDKKKLYSLDQGPRRRRLHAFVEWADREIIELVAAEAAYRGHEVDHIIPLNGLFVCGLHVHNNLQVVPKQYNLSKTNFFDPSNPSKYAVVQLT